MRIMREEIFGPVLSMMPFDSEEEAIAIANDTDYGLTNYVQSSDGEKANRVARRLRSGMVDMNGIARSSGSPFGGYKQSGNGREGGIWGLEEFLEIKAVGGWFRNAQSKYRQYYAFCQDPVQDKLLCAQLLIRATLNDWPLSVIFAWPVTPSSFESKAMVMPPPLKMP